MPSVGEKSAGLRALLRECTRVQHIRLDAQIDFGAFGLTRQRYAAFLSGVFSVVAQVEPSLARWPETGSGTSRVDRLLEDLAHLGAEAPAIRIQLKAPVTRAEAFGCAYVLEGSALGGVVMAKAVKTQLGAFAPTSYLRLHEPHTAAAWADWLSRLHGFDTTASNAERSAAIDMARATFDAYHESLTFTGALLSETTCSK